MDLVCPFGRWPSASVIRFRMIPLNSDPRRDNQSADHWTLTVSTLRTVNARLYARLCVWYVHLYVLVSLLVVFSHHRCNNVREAFVAHSSPCLRSIYTTRWSRRPFVFNTPHRRARHHKGRERLWNKITRSTWIRQCICVIEHRGW